MKEDLKNVDRGDNSVEPAEVNRSGNAENDEIAGRKDLIKGKFKSYEDLETAYDNAQKKLTQTSQKLAQLEKMAESSKSQNSQFNPDAEYMQSQKNLLLKYLPYSRSKNARTLDEFVAGLPPQLASQLGADIRGLKSGYEAKAGELAKQKEEAKNQFITKSIQEYEQQKGDELLKPCKKLAFDFYKSFGQFSPEQANAVLELTEKVINAHETQKALDQQLADENNFAKSKLTSSASSSSSPGTEGQHVYTRAEIQEMMKTPAGREKFLKVEKVIFDQMAKGLIR